MVYSPKSSKIAVEISHGFGDAIFSTPYLEHLASKYSTKLDVAIQAQCKDALLNNPNIANIHTIGRMWEGYENYARSNQYEKVLNITPNYWFLRQVEDIPSVSLLDTYAYQSCVYNDSEHNTPRQEINRNSNLFGKKPSIHLTDEELTSSEKYKNVKIAIETEYKSGQSWAQTEDFLEISKQFNGEQVLWLSRSEPFLQNTVGYGESRRVLIAALRNIDTFISVGSGFFCASMALDMQPKKIICLWLDHYYKYAGNIEKYGWHNQIKWVGSRSELNDLRIG
jgi:hypothetical protein